MDDRSNFKAARPKPLAHHQYNRPPVALSPSRPIAGVVRPQPLVDINSVVAAPIRQNIPDPQGLASQPAPAQTFASFNIPQPRKKRSRKVAKYSTIGLAALVILGLVGLNIFFIATKKPHTAQAEQSVRQKRVVSTASVTLKVDPLKNVDFTIYGTKQNAPFVAAPKDQYVKEATADAYSVIAKSIVPGDKRELNIIQQKVEVGFDKDPNGLVKTLTAMGKYQQLPTKMGMSYIIDGNSTGVLLRVNTLIIIRSTGTHVTDEWKQIFESLIVLPLYE